MNFLPTPLLVASALLILNFTTGCATSNSQRLADANVAIQSSEQIKQAGKQADERARAAINIAKPPDQCKYVVKAGLNPKDSATQIIAKYDLALDKANNRILVCYNHALKIWQERTNLASGK